MEGRSCLEALTTSHSELITHGLFVLTLSTGLAYFSLRRWLTGTLICLIVLGFISGIELDGIPFVLLAVAQLGEAAVQVRKTSSAR
jgi:hypothetical protein